MWPLASASILWLLVPLVLGLIAGAAAWRHRGSVFEVRRIRRRPRTLYWRVKEPRMPDAPAPASRMRKRRAAPQATESDDLTLIRGLGSAQAKGLHKLGVTRFAQIAAWTPAQAELYGARLGDQVTGKIEQERWREQAQLLAEGDLVTFTARFGAPAAA